MPIIEIVTTVVKCDVCAWPVSKPNDYVQVYMTKSDNARERVVFHLDCFDNAAKLIAYLGYDFETINQEQE